jgi:hypothetical protein
MFLPGSTVEVLRSQDVSHTVHSRGKHMLAESIYTTHGGACSALIQSWCCYLQQ